MILSYLKKAAAQMAERFVPEQPQRYRCWYLPDGQIVVADSNEKTEMDDDAQKFIEAPQITDWIKSGQMPPKLAGANSTNVLTSAEFAERFVAQFKAAGYQPVLEPSSAPEPSPAPEPLQE